MSHDDIASAGERARSESRRKKVKKAKKAKKAKKTLKKIAKKAPKQSRAAIRGAGSKRKPIKRAARAASTAKLPAKRHRRTQAQLQQFGGDWVIRLGRAADGTSYADACPKKGKRGDRFRVYRDGMTVSEARKAGARPKDMRDDVQRGYVVIGPDQPPVELRLPAIGDEPGQVHDNLPDPGGPDDASDEARADSADDAPYDPDDFIQHAGQGHIS